MPAQNFMRLEYVAKKLEFSKSHAYKLIRKLSAELQEKRQADVFYVFEMLIISVQDGPF